MLKKLINWLFPKKPKEEYLLMGTPTPKHDLSDMLNHAANNKTDLVLWTIDMKRKKKISARLSNSLRKYFAGKALEDITMKEFMQYRGHGIKAWEEFSILRKKYLKSKKNVK